MLEKVERNSPLIMPVKPVLGGNLDKETEEQQSQNTRDRAMAVLKAKQTPSNSEAGGVDLLSAEPPSLRESVLGPRPEIPPALVRQLYKKSATTS